MTRPSPTISMPKPRSTRYGVMRAEAFVGDAELPKSSEVVIIGGGIIGVATAYFLAKRGIEVLLCEKAEIGCEASSRAFGWVSELLLDPVKQPMTQLAKKLWAELQAEIGELGFRQEGLVNLAETDEELAMFSGWIEQAAGLIDRGSRILTSAQVAERFPTARQTFAGGLFAPSDGSVEPVLAAPRLAEAARRAGARIVTDCAVRGLDLKGGRVAGVFTEKGYVATSTAISATHCWTRLFCGNHGVDVPQIYIIMSMGSTKASDGPPGSGGTMGWAWRRQADGGYSLGGLIDVRAPVTRDAIALRKPFKPLMEMFGGAKLDFGRDAWNDLLRARHWDPRKTSPFETRRVLAGTVRSDVAATSFARNKAVFPEMANTAVAETWAGPIPMTPDNKPVMGAVDAIPGFYLVTGCSYGISWAPAIGKMMSELVAGVPTCFDPEPFRLSRFSDGSELTVAG